MDEYEKRFSTVCGLDVCGVIVGIVLLLTPAVIIGLDCETIVCDGIIGVFEFGGVLGCRTLEITFRTEEANEIKLEKNDEDARGSIYESGLLLA